MRAVIITAYLETSIKASIKLCDSDFIICADAGWDYAKQEDITPNLILGDFDSTKIDLPKDTDNIKLLRVPAEKNYTDCMLAIREALDRGFGKIVIVGGMGGRIDHTIGHLAVMSYALDCGASVELRDGSTVLMMTDAAEIVLTEVDNTYFSLISYSEKCEGVHIYDAKYLLEGYTLRQNDTIGISNEFDKKDVRITKESGRLIIIITKKD